MKRWLLLGLLLTELCSVQLWAQSRRISGTVIVENGAGGLSGATIVAKGTPNGTVTDLQGRYTLTVPPQGTMLVISAVGMQTTEISIGDRNVVDVELKADIRQLNEVIVTALGQKKERSKFASSVSTVGGRSIAQSGETGLLSGLSGKASGVLITKSGGDPGAGAYIQIRGQNTISGNAQPLFIVDGIPVSNSSFNDGSAGNNSIVQQSRINYFLMLVIERI